MGSHLYTCHLPVCDLFIYVMFLLSLFTVCAKCISRFCGPKKLLLLHVSELGRVHTCSGSRSGPVPFHSFVLRSHLQKLTGPVPVAGL